MYYTEFEGERVCQNFLVKRYAEFEGKEGAQECFGQVARYMEFEGERVCLNFLVK
jgi:hypothetical protein